MDIGACCLLTLRLPACRPTFGFATSLNNPELEDGIPPSPPLHPLERLTLEDHTRIVSI